MVGRTLSHYKILEKIGSGGMGEVYLAEDTKLHRKIALKILPPELAGNEERRARFQREAKAIAALDHPNIVTVYSVEEADGIHFITMQLARGKTLRELLPKSGFPLGTFFDIAIPLADAVAAAHQEGITHRDLKPENIMVSDEGRVKVLDFSLAKLRPELGEADASELPTQGVTQDGRILGTVNYMSPEQAEGKAVDSRSDIFSLGIIFYEMLTGQRPFRGDSATSVLSSILKDTPGSVTALKPEIPRELGKIVGRCIAKDPTRRIQSALDLRNQIEEVQQDADSAEAIEATVIISRRRRLVGVLLAGIAVVGVAAIVARSWRGPARPAAPRLMNPVQLTSASGVEDYPTWSRDGRTLAYARSEGLTGGNWDIWVTQLGPGQPVNRTSDYTGRDCCPSWSPDGSQIGFWSDREGGGYFVMSALGGPARKVMSAAPDVYRYSPPQWSANGQELAGVVVDSTGFSVEIVSMTTRESRRLILPGRTSNRIDLSWSPDGRFFAYVDGGGGHEVTGLWVLRQADGQAFPVTDGRTKVWGPSWSSDGRRLNFVSNRGGSMDLWQQPLGRDGRPDGDPLPVTVGVGIRHAVFSPDGTRLAYSQGRPVANLWRIPILKDRPATWADAQQLTFDQAYLEYFDVSLDGQSVLFSSDRSGNMDLWMLRVSGGEMMQVTSDPTPDWYPKWAPDGKEVAFYSYRSGNREIWVMPVSGGRARRLTDGQATGVESWFPAWSPNGREIAFSSTRGVNADIYAIPTEGGEARRLTKRPGINWRPIWSPDGAWVVFTSDYVLWRVPAAGGKPEHLADGAEHPQFSRDGKRLFFVRVGETTGNLRALSLQDRSERPMTDLTGRRGSLLESLASDGQYLYFAWHEDIGDIWVMDVVTDKSE